MAAASNIRMVITADWDSGFLLTPEVKPLDDVPPGGEYVVECTPQDDVLLQAVTVRDFVLDRLYVGTLFANIVADESLGETGSADDRRYRLEPPISVTKTANIRAVLKNLGSTAKKPKVAVLLRGGTQVAGSALRDWGVVAVRAGSEPRPLVLSCLTCDSPDRDVRRQLDDGYSCSSIWHNSGARAVAGHAPKLARTLYDGPGNATLINGCSCGAAVPNASAFAAHVGVPEGDLVAMLALVSIIYDFYDHPGTVTREEAACRVARCLEFIPSASG